MRSIRLQRKKKLLPKEILNLARRGYEAPSAMAAPVRTNHVNQVIRHPRTTFGAVTVNENKRTVKG